MNAGNWSTNLTLMNDITMTTPASGSSNWTPIGYRSDGQYSDKYAGTIEGNGYTIDNMVVNTPSENFAAMIVTLSGTVQNLTIGSGSYFHAKYWSASVTRNGSKPDHRKRLLFPCKILVRLRNDKRQRR